MAMTGRELWQRFCRYRVADAALGIALDVSRVRFDDAALDTPALARALEAMAALERGAIANPDEGRRVGHYWLRAPHLAPEPAITDAIRSAVAAVHGFAGLVHDGTLKGQGGTFRHLLHVGIGGSALGPQLVADALGGAGDRVAVHFIDNTDPDGIDRVLGAIGGALGRTLVTVASKSGSTPEPRNAMLEVRAAYERAGLSFHRHAAAITVEGSELDETAHRERWLQRFPLWDWVGGRTSITSAVGLVPAAVQGIDVDAFLAGASAMDEWTRRGEPRANPAALLATAWLAATGGRGAKDMVVLPYKDRLLLLGRYLQQLVMESLGKATDRGGRVVHQGIAVYGNKGSTDQHAYVQQLRDGLDNFFVTFIQVLADRDGASAEVEPGVTSGDYLCGFLQGTRRALHERGRESVTITIDRLTPAALGALVALFERAVGVYAELIDVNAYDQPGVEAGKAAAAAALDLQGRALATLRAAGGPLGAEAVAETLGAPDEAETVHAVLEHLAANPARGVVMTRGGTPRETTFHFRPS